MCGTLKTAAPFYNDEEKPAALGKQREDRQSGQYTGFDEAASKQNAQTLNAHHHAGTACTLLPRLQSNTSSMNDFFVRNPCKEKQDMYRRTSRVDVR